MVKAGIFAKIWYGPITSQIAQVFRAAEEWTKKFTKMNAQVPPTLVEVGNNDKELNNFLVNVSI